MNNENLKKKYEMESLPPEILHTIFSYCIESPQDIIKVSHVCTYFYKVMNKHHIYSKRIWWNIDPKSYPVGMVLLKHMPPIHGFKHHQQEYGTYETIKITLKRIEEKVKQNTQQTIERITNQTKKVIPSFMKQVTKHTQILNTFYMTYFPNMLAIHTILPTFSIQKHINTTSIQNVTSYIHNNITFKKKKQETMCDDITCGQTEQPTHEKIQTHEQVHEKIQRKGTLVTLYQTLATKLKESTTIYKVIPTTHQESKMKKCISYESLYETTQETQYGPYSSITSYIHVKKALQQLKKAEHRTTKSFVRVNKFHQSLTTLLRYMVPLFPALEVLAFFMLIFEQFDVTYGLLSALYHLIGVFWLAKLVLCFMEAAWCHPKDYVGRYRSVRTSMVQFMMYVMISTVFYWISGYIRAGTWAEVMLVLMLGNCLVCILYYLDSPTFVKFGTASRLLVDLFLDG